MSGRSRVFLEPTLTAMMGAIAGAGARALATVESNDYVQHGLWRVAGLRVLEVLEQGLWFGLATGLLAAVAFWLVHLKAGLALRPLTKDLSWWPRWGAAAGLFAVIVAVAAHAVADPRDRHLVAYEPLTSFGEWTAAIAAAAGISYMAPRATQGSRLCRTAALGALLFGASIPLLSRTLPIVSTPPHRWNEMPTVVLITVDTMRADHLSLYGYQRATSPRLDSWAREGRVFRNCYAHSSRTAPALTALMTGALPSETGVWRNRVPLRARFTTLAELFRNAGYRTAAVVSNYVLRRGAGLDDGFEDFDDRLPEYEAQRQLPERTASNTTRAAITWLNRRAAARPFFLWVHYQDPHGPYTAPVEYQRLFPVLAPDDRELRINTTTSGVGGIPSYQFLGGSRSHAHYVAQYDAEIRYWDNALAKLRGALLERLEGRRWLIALTADHGEGMGEHGYYFAHGDRLEKGLLHVPLVLWSDRLQTPSDAWPEQAVVGHTDVGATLLRFAGLTSSRGAVSGRDLLGNRPSDVGILSETVTPGGYQGSLIRGSSQVIFDEETHSASFFDVQSDLLLGKEKLGASGLPSDPRLAELLRRASTGSPRDRPILKDAEWERLRALGYVR